MQDKEEGVFLKNMIAPKKGTQILLDTVFYPLQKKKVLDVLFVEDEECCLLLGGQVHRLKQFESASSRIRIKVKCLGKSFLKTPNQEE